MCRSRAFPLPLPPPRRPCFRSSGYAPSCAFTEVQTSVVIVNPGGTGRPRLLISARFAPLPPSRFFMEASPSALAVAETVNPFGHVEIRCSLPPMCHGKARTAKRIRLGFGCMRRGNDDAAGADILSHGRTGAAYIPGSDADPDPAFPRGLCGPDRAGRFQARRIRERAKRRLDPKPRLHESAGNAAAVLSSA